MEGKLVKTNSTYHLVIDNKIIASMGDSDGKLHKLSFKNCQVVENWYDLDELAELYSGKGIFEDGYDGLLNPHTRMFIETSYIKGFQKALEILGDKKFSKEDMIAFGKICTNDAHAPSHKRSKTWTELLEKYIQSLQQTEWDVEIVMGGYRLNDDGEKIGFPSYELPKLDADGCLILKRK